MLGRRIASLLIPLALVSAFVLAPATAGTRTAAAPHHTLVHHARPAAPAPPARAGVTHTVNVGQGGSQFVDQDSGSGNTTTIALGDTVKWHWIGANHSSTRNINPETWSSGIKSAPTTDFTHTFNTVGTFVYWCTLHGSSAGGMRGFVTVADAAAPTISIGNVSQSEGDGGTTNFDFPVTLNHTSDSDVTVKYSTSNGSASSASDYTAVTNATVTITAGNTSATARVVVNGDTTPEPNETFTVTLNTPTGGTISDGSATGTIQNDDGPPPTPSMSVGDLVITEGNSKTTTATFTVTLSSAAVGTVTAHFETSDGTATAPADYASKSGTVTAANGATTGTFTVGVVGDRLKEPDETFTVTLSAPSGATIADGTATGTIRDTKDVCTIAGTNADDTINGTPDNDTICGLKGNDALNGMGGGDTLLGAAGNDTLTGAGGADVSKGAGGNDTLHATDGVNGNDTANGGAGTDTCDGDPGDTVTNCP